MNKKKDKSKKRVVVVNKNGQAHIKCSFNNIIISLTNESGQVISWSSAGKMGFRGSKKNTPFAAQIATEDAVKKAYELGLRTVDIFIKGPGAGRDSAIRAIQNAGLDVVSINDVTPLPHNGCRPPKRRSCLLYTSPSPRDRG